MKRMILASPFVLLALSLSACSTSAPKSEPVSANAQIAVESAQPKAVPAVARRDSASKAVAVEAAGKRQDEDARVVAELIRLSDRDDRVQEYLRHLCLVIGPRLTSSHNLATAQQWSLEQFRAMGLDAQLERWGEFPVGFDRGPFSGGIVGAEPFEFEFTTMSWTPGTKGAQRGLALFKPETEEQLAEVEGQLTGVWLVSRSYAATPRARRRSRSRPAQATLPCP
jgi:hypothetical protein